MLVLITSSNLGKIGQNRLLKVVFGFFSNFDGIFYFLVGFGMIFTKELIKDCLEKLWNFENE